jgi:hypothetical protein
MRSWRLTTCTASIQQNQTRSSAQLDACWHFADFLLGLLFILEDEGDVFLGHIGRLSPYMPT